ncbi:SSI family serine proteinase inhibitor [Streptomyces sp. NPDC088258]|uniref:SSI family serine proteinase inhibitor n=1 Tax=Streptomyces sp. NPDC088258 TaxID=3365849 RepID=UPI00382D089E
MPVMPATPAMPAKPLRRLALAAVASLAVLGAGAPAAFAGAGSFPVPLPMTETGAPAWTVAPAGGTGAGSGVGTGAAKGVDVLTVTIADSGVDGADGTFRLSCRPAGGTHQQARAACDRLGQLGGELAVGGQDPFAPVSKDTMCTMLYGGPATARITGTWQGRTVDSSFNKANGCEISRWRALEPVLPATTA